MAALLHAAGAMASIARLPSSSPIRNLSASCPFFVLTEEALLPVDSLEAIVPMQQPPHQATHGAQAAVLVLL